MALIRLLVLASLMLCSTLLASFLPQWFRFSGRTLDKISTYSTGLLIGAALTIVIPEGVAAVYNNSRNDQNESSNGHDSHSNASCIGIALLSGFILMYIIDSIHSHEPTPSLRPPPSRSNSSLHHHHPHPTPHRRPRSSLHRHASIASELDPLASHHHPYQSPPIPHHRASDSYEWNDAPTTTHNNNNHNTVPRSSSPFVTSDEDLALPTSIDRKLSNAALNSPLASPLSSSFTLSTSSPPQLEASAAFSTVIGLLVHSLADGISLGASSLTSSPTSNSLDSTSSDTSLELIIFLAIMVHKAPAAFALSSLLSNSAVSPWFIKRSLLAFSFAAPLGALTTYGILRLLGDETDIGNIGWWTGIALVFSGGTFLFVATHVMKGQEGDHRECSESDDDEEEEQHQQHSSATSRKNRNRMLLVVAGMLTPILLSSLVGHGH